MRDEISQYSRIVDQYLVELQKSSFIKQNTNKVDQC